MKSLYRCADDLSNISKTPNKFLSSSSSCYHLNNETERCEKYEYDLYMGYESLTVELNWICDSRWKLTLGQSMFFVGSVVGTLGFGILADVVGKWEIILS